VLTKSDLTDPADFLSQYAPLDVPCVVTSSHGADGDFAGLGSFATG
jgi:ribosome biogenesis GTPase